MSEHCVHEFVDEVCVFCERILPDALTADLTLYPSAGDQPRSELP